jgi:hypothetical protein
VAAMTTTKQGGTPCQQGGGIVFSIAKVGCDMQLSFSGSMQLEVVTSLIMIKLWK